nr:hypothetical protein [uncultured Cohaesibacter sp.]
MSDLKSYKVTEKAGPRMNGKPVKSGDTVQMTEKQAKAYLRTGQIVAVTSKAATKATKASSAAAASDGNA